MFENISTINLQAILDYKGGTYIPIKWFLVVKLSVAFFFFDTPIVGGEGIWILNVFVGNTMGY